MVVQTQDGGGASHCFKDLSADNEAFGWVNQHFEFTTLKLKNHCMSEPGSDRVGQTLDGVSCLT